LEDISGGNNPLPQREGPKVSGSISFTKSAENSELE
jgi:hypothetical protein